MNAFNRVLAVLLLLTVFAGALLILLISMEALDPLAILPGELHEGPLARWLVSFSAVPNGALLMNVGIALASMAGVLALLALELRRPPRLPPTLTLKDDGLGQVEVRLEAVRRLVRYVASEDPNVLEIAPEVIPSAGGLRIHCRATISPLASLRETSADFQERIKESVERHLGVKVAEISVQAQFEPLDGQQVV
jgi:hypothetical protein